MRILYVCTQRPGYGGASTEAYEAIKWLRKLGHHVHGVFVDDRPDLCDPDRIGNVVGLPWNVAEKTGALLTEKFDVAIGKNYAAAHLIRNLPMPRIYVTSGIGAMAQSPFAPHARMFAPGTQDVMGFSAASRVIVHSTLDMGVYRKWMQADLAAKLVPEVVRTSVLAARMPDGPVKPLGDRRWDLCMAASNWERETKGPAVARAICDRFKSSRKIVVCGEKFAVSGVDCYGLVQHERMLQIMGDSRVVAIPSMYDSSPNVYVEAAHAGCNVVVSPAVGNIEGHPATFLATGPTADAFATPIAAALLVSVQVPYRVETPDAVARQLESWIVRIGEGRA